MADYAKKTVAELQEILKSRGLPSSGKKAELIARLNENDKQASEVENESAAQEAEPAPTAQAEQTTTTTAVEPTPTTEAEPATQDLSIETAPATVDKPSPDTALANQTNYSLNLPISSLDNELAKRKARAERFGTASTVLAANGEATAASTLESTETAATTDAQALKNLERAKRFGTGQTAIGKLDEALPSESARASRKRGHGAVAEATELDDPGLKRSFANRGRGRGGRFGGAGRNRGGGRGPGPTAAKPQGIQKSGAPAYTSDKDKLAAEARKKKFATA